MIAIIDTGDLLEVVWTSILAGVGVTVIYGLALLGLDRAIEFGRAGRGLEAAAYGALGVICSAGVLASLVFAIFVMVDK
ncbi:MAG: hypothetical protein JW895_07470 [Thermoleophilaceae bacterium]|nr:hypothetical protein [Thermoleophilaceae bacterium]